MNLLKLQSSFVRRQNDRDDLTFIRDKLQMIGDKWTINLILTLIGSLMVIDHNLLWP